MHTCEDLLVPNYYSRILTQFIVPVVLPVFVSFCLTSCHHGYFLW